MSRDMTAPPASGSQPDNARSRSVGHFAAGLGSGITSAVMLQPLDLLKTRVQQTGNQSLAACIRDVLGSAGTPIALWRGTVPSTLRTGLGSAVYFTTLNSFRQQAHQLGFTSNKHIDSTYSSTLPTLSKSANLVTGAAARTFAGFVLMPLTIIKVRYESNLYSYKSMWDACSDIYKSERWRGFFSGFGATAIRDGPYAGLYVLFYELLKERLSALSSTHGAKYGTTIRDAGHDHMSPAINFSSGILAGALCAFVSNPFDSVKTRIQLQPKEYPNMFSAFLKMVSKDGVSSLWDGLALRMSRKALSSALAWTLYEELIKKTARWNGHLERMPR